MEISTKELEELTHKAVKKYGYNDKEVQVIADVLLYAQLRDNNQGIVKLIDKGIPKDPNAGEIVIEKETPISARINGNKNHAMLVVVRAVELVKEKAKKSGFAIAGTFNTNTSSGAIGYYASCLAAEGLIGLLSAAHHRELRFTDHMNLYSEPILWLSPSPASRTPLSSICRQPRLPILDW